VIQLSIFETANSNKVLKIMALKIEPKVKIQFIQK